MSRRDARAQRFETLYRVHAPGAWRLAYVLCGDRALAEDLVQDAFVRVLARFGDSAPEAFDPYLRKTVLNLWRSHARRARREAPVSVDGLAGTVDPTPRADDVEVVWGALARLRPRRRAAVFLRYYEGLGHGEIAAALDCSPEAAKSLLRHGLDDLRKYVKETT